ncbi:hypothetical protein Tco_1099286 [Tanacetum coccineum]
MEESPKNVKDKADELIPENLYDTDSEIQTVNNENDDDTHSMHHSEDTIHAFAELNIDLQSLHEHLNHIFKEVSLLHSNMADLESNLITKVSDDIKSTMPNLINNVLQEQLPGLLSATLKECLPIILTETLQAQVSIVSEQLGQTQTTLNKQTMKKIKKQFAIAHQTEREKFMVLQKALTNVLRLEIDQSVTNNMLEISNLLHLVDYDDETTKGEKTKKESKNPDTTQGEQPAEPENELRAMILHTSKEKKEEAEIVNVADSTNSDDFDTQPLSKNLILLELPIRDKSKGKEVAKDDSMLEITSLLEEGGSTQKTLMLSKKNNDY